MYIWVVTGCQSHVGTDDIRPIDWVHKMGAVLAQDVQDHCKHNPNLASVCKHDPNLNIEVEEVEVAEQRQRGH